MAVLSGGKKLQAALEKIAREVKSSASVEVGFFPDATYPDGTKVAMVAAIQEFGAPSKSIPPRPFFRSAIREHAHEWGGQLAGMLRRTEYDVAASLEAVGMVIQGQVQLSIRDTDAPPNAASTIKRKGFNDPLIDTGQMLNSVTSVVKS